MKYIFIMTKDINIIIDTDHFYFILILFKPACTKPLIIYYDFFDGCDYSADINHRCLDVNVDLKLRVCELA